MIINVARKDNLNQLIKAQESGGWCYSINGDKITVATGFFGKLGYLILKIFKPTIDRKNLQSAILNILLVQEKNMISNILNRHRIKALLDTNTNLNEIKLDEIGRIQKNCTKVFETEIFTRSEVQVSHPLFILAEKLNNVSLPIQNFDTVFSHSVEDFDYLTENRIYLKLERILSLILTFAPLDNSSQFQINYMKEKLCKNNQSAVNPPYSLTKDPTNDNPQKRGQDSIENLLTYHYQLEQQLPPELIRIKRDLLKEAAKKVRQAFNREIYEIRKKSTSPETDKRSYLFIQTASTTFAGLPLKDVVIDELTSLNPGYPLRYECTTY